jgi:hypothetical protein
LHREEPKHTRYLRLFIQDLNEVIMLIQDEKQKLDTMKLSSGPRDYNYIHALEGALNLVERRLETLKREYGGKLPKPNRVLSPYIQEGRGASLLDQA